MFKFPEPALVSAFRRIELITGSARRRQWSSDEKARIVSESLRPGANVSEVARRNGLSPNQLFAWRRQAQQLFQEGAGHALADQPATAEVRPSSRRKAPRVERPDLDADPFCGAVYVFRSKRMDRVKLLWWDGTGICLMMKRLEDSKFHWPPIEDGMIKLSAAQLSALLEGVAWAHVERREVIRPSAAQ